MIILFQKINFIFQEEEIMVEKGVLMIQSIIRVDWDSTYKLVNQTYHINIRCKDNIFLIFLISIYIFFSSLYRGTQFGEYILVLVI